MPGSRHALRQMRRGIARLGHDGRVWDGATAVRPIGRRGQDSSRGSPLGVPAARIVFPADDRAEIAAAVTGILATGSLTLGPYTRQFEEAFAAAHDARYAAATSSGTSALDI